jgi:ketosteroid isomerase-like protein
MHSSRSRRGAAPGRCLLVPALLVLAGCSARPPAADPSAAREALLEADREFARQSAERGTDGWMAAYTADAVRLHMGRTAVQGLAVIRAFDAGLFADPALRLVWTPTHAGAFADGRHGYTTGRAAFVRVVGGDTTWTGTYVTLWRREAGRWRVILDTGASDPPR